MIHKDEIVWKDSEDGNLKMSSGIISIQSQVDWHDMVWFKGNINKHSSCLWHALHNALKTRSLLADRNILNDQLCVLCNGGSEDISHLLISYPSTASIRAVITSRVKVNPHYSLTLSVLLR